MSIKQMLKAIYYKKIKKWNPSQIRIHHLRRAGMHIGENSYIFSDDLETPEPYLVSVGDHVMVAAGVRFATHDASACYYIPGASDLYGRITIGNHCFLGMGSLITPGVTLADNCIVGAGSVVTKSFLEPGTVIAGNPARKICTTEELRSKNESYALNTWGMTFQEKREYLLENEKRFKGYRPS
jgi:acetyltransferase-like isoleucine patch superfamily enzyme